MNRYLVIVQSPDGYPSKQIPVEEAPVPPEPQIHTAILVSDIEEYLDAAIRLWRNTRDNASDDDERITAIHYVDAFQSARSSILDKTLP